MKRVLKQRLRATVLLTLKGGSTFRGLLFDLDRDAFVLRNVSHLVDGADTATPVDGELIVLTADVLYMQLV